ncbi:2346_t:CDS:2, partial [Gigaspora rosea]
KGRNEDEVTQSEEKDNTEEELMSQSGEKQEQKATIGEVAVPIDED